jgi:dTDP-4-amino-4,6-dideoxygalactose transaminase
MSLEPVPFNDLSAEGSPWAEDVRGAVSRVLRSGWFILGPEVQAFEREFAEALGARHAVSVGNGTDAITLALLGLGIGPDDEVVTSPLSAAFTSLAISRLGARPVHADVEPDTLTLSVDAIARCLTRKTRAIVPVHLYGNAADVESILELARDHGLEVVEDACQAHGARLSKGALGTFGKAGAFSFYPTKNLGALGDGGMIVTDDAALADRLRRLRNGGQSSRYVHDEIGFNSRLDELQAAILRAKLPHLEAENVKRRAHASLYQARLRGAPVELVRVRDGCTSARHLFVVRTRERDRLAEHLKARGVQTLVHYPIPTHLQPAYLGLGQGEGSCPTAEQAAREILSLPLYPALAPEAVERVASSIREFSDNESHGA